METVLLQEKIRQHSQIPSIDPFVIDFCEFWAFIHQTILEQRIPKISKTRELTFAVRTTHTLPFYEKYQHFPFLVRIPAFWDRLASIYFRWKGGVIAFPLRLITYELAHSQENWVTIYIDKLMAGEIKGDIETLFAFLFPKLYQMALPLTTSDVGVLKAYQMAFDHCSHFLRGPTTKEFVADIPQLTPETIRNKIEQFTYFQIAVSAFFLDMGKLGYETYLFSHQAPLPPLLEKYCLHTVNFDQIRMSLLHLPFASPRLFSHLQEFQARDIPARPLCLPLARRIHSWNLTDLGVGKNNWALPFPFFYGNLGTAPQTSNPTLDLSLVPTFDPFRPLNPADVKLLAFLTTLGNTIRVKDMCTQLQLHHKTVVSLMAEYRDHQLLHRVVQFFNIGLDLRASFYLRVSHQDQEFPFLLQCSTLPRMDVYLAETKGSSIYFGHVDLPRKWVKELVDRMRSIRDKFPEITLHYTFEPASHAKWNLSLKDTYSRPI